MSKFLDGTGLTVLWNKIKSNFVLNTKKASTSELGLVKDGDGVSVDANGVLNLDKASASQLGGVKIGKNINVDADGTISVNDSSAPANDAKITIKANNTEVGSFTTNQATPDSINIPIPTSLPNPNALTFGSKTYNGSSAATITASDLGLANAYKYRGSKPTYADIEAITSKEVGDVWNAQDSGMNYAWTGTVWDALGSDIDTPLSQQDIEDATPLN